MHKRRALWAAAVLLSALGYFFDNNTATLAVLVATALLPLLGLLPLLCPVTATLDLPQTAEKGQRVTGTVYLKNDGVLPLASVMLRLECRNLRTGEKSVQCVRKSLLPKERGKAEFTLEGVHCGTVCLAVTQLAVYDLFGLARRRRDCSAAAELTVLPTLFRPEVVLADSAAALPDSEIYSRERPGSDPGETFAVREYIPGDGLRKIHWKLSEKVDRLMVRDFGLPVINEVLLLLETADRADAQTRSAITEVFASVSESLLAQGCVHQVGWDRAGEFRMQTISCAEDFDRMLDELLRLPPCEAGSAAHAFGNALPHGGFAHVAVFASQYPAGLQELHSGNRVSVLLCGDGAAEGLQADGTHLLGFDSIDYAQTLCRVEV